MASFLVAATGNGGAETYPISATLADPGSKQNRYVQMAYGQRYAGAVLTPTIGGSTPTSLGNNSSANFEGKSFGRVLGDGSGTIACSVAQPDEDKRCLGAMEFDGVDQTTPLTSRTEANGSPSTPVAVTAVGVSNGKTMSLWVELRDGTQAAQPTFSTPSGWTLRVDTLCKYAGDEQGCVLKGYTKDKSGDGDEVVSQAPSASVSWWAEISVLNDAAAAASPPLGNPRFPRALLIR